MIDASKTYQSLSETVLNSNKKIIKSVDLFDVYQGDKLPENKKSYAIRLTLQSSEKTLVDADIEKCLNKVVKDLIANHQVELR